MAAMANITVKANDGTTDVIYNAKCASAGDKIAAVWRVDSAFVPLAYRSSAEMMSRPNATRDARRVELLTRRPVTAGAPALLVATPLMKTELVAPSKIVQSEIDEIVSQHINLLKSALIQGCFKEGYAPQ